MGIPMKFAIFRCCPTSQFLRYYETSTNTVLAKLGVTIIDVKEFNCCGYPLRSTDKMAYLLASVRNLAVAAGHGLGMITLCNCCFESLKQAKSIMDNDASMHDRISEVLLKEGLVYRNDIQVRHVFEVMLEDIGIDDIKAQLVARYDGLKIATHYGCHLLRPSQILHFDDPVAPTRFDDLVKVTGAQSIAWASKLECCGAPAWGVHDTLSINLTKKKIADALAGGADFLCVACVYCQLQFDRVQHMVAGTSPHGESLAPILYTQLLGLALGLEPADLGLDQHCIDSSELTAFLTPRLNKKDGENLNR
jgi:heterodisulfide reductase subunit B